jgi:hypothetical protein
MSGTPFSLNSMTGKHNKLGLRVISTVCPATNPTTVSIPVRRLPCFLALLLAAALLPSSARAQQPGFVAPTVIPISSRRETPPIPPVINTLTDDPFYSLERNDRPPATDLRDASGRPGPHYWQQRADYTIRATLDTGAKTIDATMAIRYVNNSPAPLDFVWLQLEQNLFRPDSLSASFNPAADTAGGIDVDQITVDGRPATLEVHGTMGRLDLPQPLAGSGGRATLAMHFHFVIPRFGAGRMGHDTTEYMIAQWYPRVAVYDDIRGWNADPYEGDGEFYLEYGDFDYAVTVPAGYTVAGSGTLRNARDVLSGDEQTRVARALIDTGIVPIVTDSAAQANRTRAVPGTKTWHFVAQNVRDAVWATAPDFRWDAAQCGTPDHAVLCQALYSHRARADWTHAAEETRFSIRHYSQLLAPYPYPQATSVAGPTGGGMEYPMVTFDSFGGDEPDANFGVLNHEMGHQWFPMLVGSNERRYAWMDEGFNTYINIFAADARGAARGAPPRYPTETYALTRRSPVPLMAAADRGGMGVAYDKTGAALLVLRDQIVGRALFDHAFRVYVQRWAYKHPTPVDFFRTIEDVSGLDLSWFWRGFFYTNDVLDIAIDTMFATRPGDAPPGTGVVTTVIGLRRTGMIPFPVSLRVKFADGSTRDVRLSVNALGLPRTVVRLDAATPAVGARLWPAQGQSAATAVVGRRHPPIPLGDVPDSDPSNDTWGDAPDPTPPAHPVAPTG